VSAGAIVNFPIIKNSYAKNSPGDNLNIAVIGIRSRGKDQYRALAKIPNVKISVLCDIDQRLFPEAVGEVEALTGYKPAIETEYRKVLDNKDIDAVYLHFKNFTDCVRSGKWQNLNADILEGHISTSLCHLGNIACRLERTLHFDPHSEKFIDDDQADDYLTKMYRAPYILPERV